MPPAPSDALCHSGFYESLKRRVWPLAPPDEGRPFSWFLEKALSFAFWSLIAVAGCGLISLVGAHLPHTGPPATSVLLGIALFASKNDLADPHCTNGIAVLNSYPFTAGQKHRWFWVKESTRYKVAAGLAMLTVILWLLWGRAFNSVTMPLLAGAGALAWVNAAAAMALLRYFTKSSRALLAVVLVIAAGFSDDLSPLRMLNPVYWPLLAVESVATTTGWVATAGAVLFPILVRLAVRRQAREISARLTAPVAEQVQENKLAAPGQTSPPGFWERLIQRTRTPQEQVLAEFCVKPGAESLGRSCTRSALIGAGVLVLSLALIPWFLRFGLKVDDPVRFHIFFPLLLALGALCAAGPQQDGFPFVTLTSFYKMPDGQSVLPAALLPVGMKTIWQLWLKSLWPRLLLFTIFLALAALVSGWWVQGRSIGLHLCFAALLCTPICFCGPLVLFTLQFIAGGTAWRRYSFRWFARGISAVTGFGGVVCVFIFAMKNLPAAALEDSPGRFATRVVWLCLPMILGTLLMTAVHRFARPDHWSK